MNALALHTSDPFASFALAQSPRTRRAYASDLRQFFQVLGVKPSAEVCRALTPSHVAQFAAAIGRRDDFGNLTNASTVARKLAAVRSLFKWLQACGVVEVNPALFIKPPRVPNHSKRQGLTAVEARALVGSVRGDDVRSVRDRAILLLGLYAGLRRAEISGLTLGDVYEERGRVVVRVLGKGGKVRVVPLNPEVVEALKAYVAAARGGEDRTGPLFVSSTRTTALTASQIWRLVVGYAKAAGIEKTITPHSLRHTAITLALDGGAKLERVQVFAGHANPATTFRYFRSADDIDRSAALAIAF